MVSFESREAVANILASNYATPVIIVISVASIVWGGICAYIVSVLID